MKIFLDTNIIIDFIFHREEFFDSAKKVLMRGVQKKDTLYISALTLVTTLYVSKHYQKSVHETKQSLLSILKHINVVDLTANNTVSNLSQDREDYEDSTQFSSAIACKADLILTRNEKDFQRSSIKAMTPDKYLNSLITQSATSKTGK